MRTLRNIPWQDLCTKDNYECFLLDHCDRKSLVAQAMAIFRKEYGGVSESLGEMGEGLADFVDLSDMTTLVSFIAKWSDLQKNADFVAECKETAEEESDPYAAQGIREQE